MSVRGAVSGREFNSRHLHQIKVPRRMSSQKKPITKGLFDDLSVLFNFRFTVDVIDIFKKMSHF